MKNRHGSWCALCRKPDNYRTEVKEKTADRDLSIDLDSMKDSCEGYCCAYCTGSNDFDDEVKELERLASQAVKEAIAKHHAAGRKVPVMRNGKIEWI